MKKTIVLGASPDSSRFSYKVTVALMNHKHSVVPVGIKDGVIDGVQILKGQPHIDDVDTITLYINPQRQADYYKYIIDLKPRRVIFNPGTENEEFIGRCDALGIETIAACTLVLLSSGKY